MSYYSDLVAVLSVCVCCVHMCRMVLCWVSVFVLYVVAIFFFFQAEDGIRDLVRSRGLGDVYKRQRELFTLSVIAVAVGIAFGSAELFGVSFALGAFFALSLIHI